MINKNYDEGGIFRGSAHALIFMLIGSLLLAGCAGSATPAPPSPTAVSMAASSTPPATQTEVIPTETPTVLPTATYTVTPSPTDTALPTETATASPTATETLPPPTPSSKDAILIYLIQPSEEDSGKCDDSLVPINTGVWRSGDVATDVAEALRRLFVKQEYIAGLYNPAFRSNISVDLVDFHAFSEEISIRLSGTYVRSGDRCDDQRVRSQVWSTIRQFPGVKTVDILLNGNLLGDILATRQN